VGKAGERGEGSHATEGNSGQMNLRGDDPYGFRPLGPTRGTGVGIFSGELSPAEERSSF
jgi:hypothetical protein